MNDIIERVEEGLKHQSSPHDLADMKAELSSHYSFVCGQLEDIWKRKPIMWLSMRKNLSSDKACDKAYEGTEDGINEMVFKLRLKRMDKLFSAISSLLRLAENESRNQF